MEVIICEVCNKHFGKKSQLRGHRKVHSGTRFACGKCDKILKSRDGLLKHSMNHTGLKPYVCSTCGKTFSDGSSHQNHEKYQHPTKDLVIKCDVCDKHFRRHKTLKLHKVMHERGVGNDGSRLKLTNDVKIDALKSVAEIGVPKTSELMKIPYTTIRNWMKACKMQYNCQYCGKVLSSQLRLEEHERTQHENKKIRQSKFNKTFRQEVAEYANQNNIKDACTKFDLVESTVRNILKTFKNPFSCEVCDRKCSYKRQLERHMAEVHKNKVIHIKPRAELALIDYIASENIDVREISEGLNKKFCNIIHAENIVKLEPNIPSDQLNFTNGETKPSTENKEDDLPKENISNLIEENNFINSETEESCEQMDTTKDIEKRSNIDRIYNIREEIKHELHLLEKNKEMLEKNERFNMEGNVSERKDNLEADEEMQRDKLMSNDILEKNERTVLREEENHSKDNFEVGKDIEKNERIEEVSLDHYLEDLDKSRKEMETLLTGNILAIDESLHLAEKDSKVNKNREEENSYKEELSEQSERSRNENKRIDIEEEMESPNLKDIQLAVNDNNSKKSQDNTEEFEAIMGKMKAMNPKEVGMFMDFLKSTAAVPKGLNLYEVFNDDGTIDQCKEEIKEEKDQSKLKDTVKMEDETSLNENNKKQSKEIKSEDILTATEQMVNETFHKRDADNTNADKTNADKTDEVKTNADKTDEVKTYADKTDEFKTNADKLNLDQTNAENTNVDETNAEEDYFIDTPTIKPYKLIPNTGYDSQVDLKSFGIDEEAEVIEISSDFIHNEKLIKSAFGKTYRKKKKIFKCSNCDKTFTSPCDMKRHMISHSGVKAFQCTHCNSAFTLLQNLHKHVSAYHDDNFKGFLCPQCPREFKEKAPLSLHIIRAHTNEKPFKCSQCVKSYSDKRSLTDHIEVDHEGKSPYKFTCSECGKQFKRADEFKFHCKTHSEGKPFCYICGASFTFRSNCNKHMKLHENPDLAKDSKVNCNICHKTLRDNGNLKRHMKSHTGQKDYICSDCGKAYSEKRQLQNHNDIVHEGKRKFSCDECSKSFTRYTSLKAHELLHKGFAVFQCEICPVKYKEKRNLNNHIKKQHE